MAVIKLPYHTRQIEINIEDKYLRGVLRPRPHAAGLSQTQLINEALDSPIESPPLEALVCGKRGMVIITSDHTRPLPSGITLPIILKRARAANPAIDITIAVASGSHRKMTPDEIQGKFGPDIARNEKIIIHDARQREDMVTLGELNTGLRVEVNRAIIETDLLMAEGFIEPHFFAGFSGGRKSLFPGMASLECIMANHCARYIGDPNARTGILERNPVHEEALAMAKLAGLSFILNVVLDGDKRVIKAFAGHYDRAHLAGCEFVRSLSEVPALSADIVITTNGGYPLDQNIYQSIKGLTAAEACCDDGGVIIMLSSCCDGHGGESFYRMMREAPDPETLARQITGRGRQDTKPDQWQAQILARVLMSRRVIMVTDMCERKLFTDMHMAWAGCIDEALVMARAWKGPEASITVIPDGVGVIVTEVGRKGESK